MAAGGASDGVDRENTDSVPVSSGLMCLEVLQIIKEAQQQHGLRHGDFQRYRQYCSRRLRRTRKSLHFPQGTRNKVQPKHVTPAMLTDSRYLYIPLFLSERAWGCAMQLKTEANTEPRKRPHMISRLKKALMYSEELQTLCESDKCDARTKLEAQAYHAFIKGTLHFERENWKSAIEHFTSAKTVYEKLSSALVDEVKDIYLQRCEEISPNIRYCAYNIGDDSAIQDLMQMRLKGGTDTMTNRLDELIEKTRERQTATLSEVTWRGRTVPVKSEHVRVCLLSVQELTNQLTDATDVDNKLSVYETLLKELIDAQQALREDCKDDPMLKHMMRGKLSEDGRVPNAVYLHSYLTFMRLSSTIERNLLMITSMKANLPGAKVNPAKKITKPQDLARLYDIITQSLNEISSLPGLEEDLTLSQETTAQTMGYKAFRCYYVAQTYTVARKWRESLALYERVCSYADQSLQAYSSLKMDPGKKKTECDNLEQLKKDVDGEKYSCHASSILDTEGATDLMAGLTVKSNKILEDRLDQYYEDPHLLHPKKQTNTSLTRFPPDFQPVPCKPLFFDVALSNVAFPSLEDKLEARKQQQTGGITGLVKGWLWGGGKK